MNELDKKLVEMLRQLIRQFEIGIDLLSGEEDDDKEAYRDYFWRVHKVLEPVIRRAAKDFNNKVSS